MTDTPNPLDDYPTVFVPFERDGWFGMIPVWLSEVDWSDTLATAGRLMDEDRAGIERPTKSAEQAIRELQADEVRTHIASEDA